MMENEKAEIAKLVAKYGKVQSLMQYVNSKTLKESYLHQPKHKAVGVDEVTKEEYGEKLAENIDASKQSTSRNLKSSLLDSVRAKAVMMRYNE